MCLTSNSPIFQVPFLDNFRAQIETLSERNIQKLVYNLTTCIPIWDCISITRNFQINAIPTQVFVAWPYFCILDQVRCSDQYYWNNLLQRITTPVNHYYSESLSHFMSHGSIFPIFWHHHKAEVKSNLISFQNWIIPYIP